MLFNSVEYILFLFVVTALFFALPLRFRWAGLLLANCVFYMWWNAAYVLLLLASSGVDYLAGLYISRARTSFARRSALLVSLCSNLSILFVFKYWTLFHTVLHDVLSLISVPYTPRTLHVLLPVGISFYTFQAMSYTIDVYRGVEQPVRDLRKYALFATFFPQLEAGPIERARAMIPQFEGVQRFDLDRACLGLQRILWGLFKKVVIADRLAPYVEAVYGNVSHHNGATLVLATYAFAFEIYCDFSGYSDMAIGSAQLLGFELMRNFERPYFSRTMTEFWRRWHISLSSWLRDYLYISLGGNRGSKVLLYRNLMITMVLGGLWHGANWTFLIWGALQGIFLCLSRATLGFRDNLIARLRLPTVIVDPWRMFVTFQLTCCSWIFFRSASLRDAVVIFENILSPWKAPFLDKGLLVHAGFGVAILLLVEALEARVGSVQRWISQQRAPLRWALWYGLLSSIVLFGVESGSQFIYFQF